MKPIVIMLEDARPRVDWFRAQFPDVELLWAPVMADAFELLKTVDRSRLRLIILDHDLGDVQPEDYVSDDTSLLVLGPGATWPLDKNGNNGMHAVDMIDRGWSDVPVIVWSINTPRAQEMVLRLRDKGFIAEWYPHLKPRLQRLRDAIASQVE